MDIHSSPVSQTGTAEATWLRWTNAGGGSGRPSSIDETDIGDDAPRSLRDSEASVLEYDASENIPFADQGAALHIDNQPRYQADDFFHLPTATANLRPEPEFDEPSADRRQRPMMCRYPILNAPEEQDPHDFEPVDASPLLPPLDFKPLILRNWVLVGLCAFYAGLITGVSILYWFQNNDRIFHTRATVSHFTIRILPSAIGSLSTLIFQSVTTNFYRIVPYISMANSNAKSSGSRTLLAQYFPFMTWQQALRNQQFHLVCLFALQLLANIVVTPLKSTLIHRTVSKDDPDLWIITISSVSALILMFIYSLLFLAIIALTFYLWRQQTGLKWDPVSIADHLTLLQGSDVLEDFCGLEYSQRSRLNDALFDHLRSKRYRLGYWRHKPTQQYWHGIRKSPKPPIETHNDGRFDNTHDAPSLTDQSVWAKDWWASKYKEVLKNPFLCYSKLYTLISDLAELITWLLVAVYAAAGLYYITTGLLTTGFTLAARSIQVTSLIINFIPTLLLQLLGTYWFQIDVWYRQLQPFMGLRKPSPATENLLLGYSCDLPVVITIKALANKHWRLAFTSIMPLVQRLLPILAGSLLSIASISDNTYHISVAALPFKAATGMLLAYLVLIPFVWPGLDRRLPVLPLCIASLWVLFYDSTLVRKDAFLPRRVDDQRWHMEYRLCLEERLYGFGAYKGRYNAIHIGIDDVYGHSSDEMGFRFVAPLKPPMRWHRKWLKSLWVWSAKKMNLKRQPTLLPEEFEAQERLHLELYETRTSDRENPAVEIELLDRNRSELRERRGAETGRPYA